MSERRMEELLGRLKELDPEMHGRLAKLREERPQSFQRSMGALDRFVSQLDKLPGDLRPVLIGQRRDNVALVQTVRTYRAEADPARKAELRRQAADLTGRVFDAEQKLKLHDLQQLSKQIGELRKELADRTAQRDRIIQSRVERLLEAPASRPR
jgi:hypothetical protein